MKLILLGTTGYHPNDRRQTACFALPQIGVVLDAGTGMYRLRPLLATKSLDIFLTHAHLDHIIGLTFLFDVLYEKQVDVVRVHGEAAKLDAIERHLFSELIFPARPPMELHPLDGPVAIGGDGRVGYFPLEHPGGTVGYRIDWPDRSLAYVTDTTAHPQADYIDKIRGVDLLLHECYFPDAHRALAEKTGHSFTTAVAELARDADVGRLVLVHINPLATADDPIDLPAAQAIFPATEIGHDQMELEVSS